MYEGQYLITKSQDPGVSVYSPWGSRGGDHAQFTVEIIQAEGATLVVDVFTKNSEDQGDGTTNMGTSGTLSAPGREPFDSSVGSMELVRFRFTAAATMDGTEGFVLFRMLPTAWYDATKA